MTYRPSFNQIYMQLALGMSERSTCARLRVGCVITSTDHRKVYAVGYNGNVSKGRNDCDRHGPEAIGNCGCIHAEANAVINCDTARHHPKIVYVTTMPCAMCAKYLVNLGGVEHVFFKNLYRSVESFDVLRQADIALGQLHETSTGESYVQYIVDPDYFTPAHR